MAAGRPFGAPPPGVDPPLRGIPAAEVGALPLLRLSAAWCLLEFLRSHLLSGFGWNLLAHTQWNWLRVIQISDVTGGWGVSFLVVLVNATIYVVGTQYLFPCWQGVRGNKYCVPGICFLLLGAALSYGTLALMGRPVPSVEGRFHVALLQGNVPQPKKWDESFQEAIWKRYEQLVRQATELKPNLIVWPETAVPGFLEDSAIRDRLNQIVRSAGVPMLVGAPTESSNSEHLYNSAILLSPQGVVVERYDKVHLVPFGEFVPLKPLLGWINNVVPIGDFSPGSERTVFQTYSQPSSSGLTGGSDSRKILPFSVLICFEDLFPELARNSVRAGARWLLVVTNDAWFERSAGSLQHLQCSVFRAVENRVWVGRAANTGWTGFVTPWGEREGGIPRFKAGVAERKIFVHPSELTLYGRWGDWFLLVCAVIMGVPCKPSTN